MGAISPPRSPRVIDLAHLHRALVEVVEQAGVDADFAEVLAERRPGGAAATGGAKMDADHPVAPHVGGRRARDADLVGRVISDPPRQLATQRAVAVGDPLGAVGEFDADVAAVAGGLDGHESF